MAYRCFFFRSISVFKRLVTTLIYYRNFLFGNTQISDDIAFCLFANSDDMLGVLGSVKKFFIVNFSIKIRIPLGVTHKNKVVNRYHRWQMLSNTFGNFSRKSVIDIYREFFGYSSDSQAAPKTFESAPKERLRSDFSSIFINFHP